MHHIGRRQADARELAHRRTMEAGVPPNPRPAPPAACPSDRGSEIHRMGNGRASRERVSSGDCATSAARGSWQSRGDTFIAGSDFASATGRIPHSQNVEIGLSWRGEFPRPALPPRRARHCGAGDFSFDPADDSRGDAV